MIRVPLSRHTITPRALAVDVMGEAVILELAPQSPVNSLAGSFSKAYITPGEARYLAEALIDAAGRVDDAAS